MKGSINAESLTERRILIIPSMGSAVKLVSCSLFIHFMAGQPTPPNVPPRNKALLRAY